MKNFFSEKKRVVAYAMMIMVFIIVGFLHRARNLAILSTKKLRKR